MGKSRNVFPKFDHGYLSSLTFVFVAIVVHSACTYSHSRIVSNWNTAPAAYFFPKYFPTNYYPPEGLSVSYRPEDRNVGLRRRNSKYAIKKQGHVEGTREKEVDSTLDDLLEVMGPHLFLIPFVLTALPFAIPAVPLSYIISRRENEHAPITELFTHIMELSANKTNTLKPILGAGKGKSL